MLVSNAGHPSLNSKNFFPHHQSLCQNSMQEAFKSLGPITRRRMIINHAQQSMYVNHRLPWSLVAQQSIAIILIIQSLLLKSACRFHNYNTQSMQDSLNSETVLQLQNAYAAMLDQLEKIQEEKRNLVLEREAELSILSSKLEQKTSYLQSMLWDKNKRIGQMEETIKRLQSQENQKNRREMRRYVESNNEKEAENNSLKRQINSLKNKINALETELGNLSNMKEDLELFIVKGIEQLRITNKEISNNIEETDTEKMVMESKYKQTNEKINMLTEKITQLEIKLRNSEEMYAHAKSSLKQSKDQALNQKFEIERLKEHIRSLKLNENFHHKPSQNDDYLTNEVLGIIELGNVLRQRESFLKQVAEYHEMNVSLVEENHQLKMKMGELEEQLDQIKSKYVAGYQDSILRKADLPLFEYLQDKKNHFLNFEQTIEKIETYIEEKDQAIASLINTFINRQNQCICGKQAEVAKLQSELAKAQAELDPIIKKNQHYEEALGKFRKDLVNYEKILETYRVEIRDILSEGKKGKKKGKKRCLHCMISFEKNEFTENCQDCKKAYHVNCINSHKCELYKLDDGFSCMSGADI